MASVYLETTIIGHIAGRDHSDPLVAMRQQMTRDWWRSEAGRFEVVVSQVVLEECSHGDPAAATERLAVVNIAVAAVNGVDYLSTWNCKHIANATLRSRIEKGCRDSGYEPPTICTPEELVEIDDEFQPNH
jgi:hypothetical protein